MSHFQSPYTTTSPYGAGGAYQGYRSPLMQQYATNSNGGSRGGGVGYNPPTDPALAAQQGKPLPSDLTGYYKQIQDDYARQMQLLQQQYNQMQGYQQQMNDMLGQDTGKQEHDLLMSMNKPIIHSNEMNYLWGY